MAIHNYDNNKDTTQRQTSKEKEAYKVLWCLSTLFCPVRVVHGHD